MRDFQISCLTSLGLTLCKDLLKALKPILSAHRLISITLDVYDSRANEACSYELKEVIQNVQKIMELLHLIPPPKWLVCFTFLQEN